jgi:hypothetical protein|tara:strand:- start:1385 stop:1798 length:414 start_codon:yes stop_codon:yes gene_type:complete
MNDWLRESTSKKIMDYIATKSVLIHSTKLKMAQRELDKNDLIFNYKNFERDADNLKDLALNKEEKGIYNMSMELYQIASETYKLCGDIRKICQFYYIDDVSFEDRVTTIKHSSAYKNCYHKSWKCKDNYYRIKNNIK